MEAPDAVPATADGSPVFVDRAAATGLDFVHFNGMSGRRYISEVTGSGAALFDYDGDGDLDAFLVQGDRLSPAERYEDATPPPPAGDRPPRDRLFKNLLVERGELAFADVTEAAGFEASGYGMGVAVGDVDGDGDPDLYVSGLGDNRLWINRGDGTFTDATDAAGANDPRWSTSATFFDADLDGDLDLWVDNYLAWTADGAEDCASLAGHPDYCGPLSYPPVADRLLLNRGDGTFVNASTSSGIRFSFGAGLGVMAVDLLGDPRPEVYVANDASANQLWSPPGDRDGEGSGGDRHLVRRRPGDRLRAESAPAARRARWASMPATTTATATSTSS